MPAVQDDSQRNGRTAKRILAIGLPLVVIAGTGIGYAFWTTTGGGTGSATSADAAAVVLSGTAPGVAPGQDATVTIKATNSNPYAVNLNTITAALTDSAQATCAGAPGGGTVDVSVGTPVFTAPVSVPANQVTPVTVGTVTVHMTNAAYNQNGCKNTTFGLTFGAS